jgi:hypothetical protein
MNNFQLEHCLTTNNSTQKVFKGVYTADHLSKVFLNNGVCIANTATSSSTGEHWVCFYINNNTIEVFDSSGKLFLENKYFKKFIQNNLRRKKLKYNACMIQHPKSNVCGLYCCVFALYKSRYKSFEAFINLFSKKDFKNNDQKIVKLFRKYFKIPICTQTSKHLYLCK